MPERRSMAEERWEYIRAHPSDVWTDFLSISEEHPEAARYTEAIKKRWPKTGDPSQNLTDRVSGSVRRALVEFDGDYARRPEELTFGMVDRYDAVATMTTYSDGSGLALISDELAALAVYLGRILTWRSSVDQRSWGRLRGRRLGSSRNLAERSDEAEMATVALLRYYLIHQRVYGLPGKLGILLPRIEERYTNVIGLAAVQFLAAHEAAHFVLGHAPTDHQQLEMHEFLADGLAYGIARRTLPDSNRLGMTLPLLGARLALLAVELAENAAFVRRPATHPPAADRWKALLDLAAHSTAEATRKRTESTATAVATAQQVRRPVGEPAWEALLSSPVVSKRIHGREYLETISQLDDIAGRSDHNLRNGLGNFQRDFGRNVRERLDLVGEHPADGFTALGFEPNVVGRLCDPTAGVSFYTLVNSLEESPLLADVGTPGIVTCWALIVTLLLAPLLPSQPGRRS